MTALTSLDWNHVRTFLSVARTGSHSASARELGISQPTVGRHITALEEALATVLMERVGARWQLTGAATELLEPAERMLAASEQLALTAAGRSSAVDGLVSVTASQLISAHLLPRPIARIRAEHPGIRVEVVASNDVRDLLRREADIAVRNARPSEEALIARNLGLRHAVAFASPDYLDRIGRPTRAADLRDVAFIGFQDGSRIVDFLSQAGVPITPRDVPYVVSDHLVQMEMARQGVGVVFAMESVGDADPALQRLVPDFPLLPVPMWLICHRELHTSRRIRLVFDALARDLSVEPS